jgi:hypothetical protein
MKNALAGLKVRPKRRANGSPRTGETSADLLRSVPTSFPTAAPAEQPSWRDIEAYDPQVLSAAAGRGITGALEGTKQLAGSARDYLGGLMQSIRERSPEELRGTAPAQSRETFDMANQAMAEAAGDPVAAARKLASAFVDVGAEAVKSPASMTEFIAGNITPGRRTRTKLEASRPENIGQVVTGVYDKDIPRSFVDRYVRDGKRTVEYTTEPLSLEQKTAIKTFFENKAKNYFVKQFGTPNDPVFKAILRGDLSNTKMMDDFPRDRIDALTQGKTKVSPTGETRFFPKYPDLLPSLTRRYDELANVQSYVYRNDPSLLNPEGTWKTDVARAQEMGLQERQIEELLAQGVPVSQANVKMELAVPAGDRFPGVYDSTMSALLEAAGEKKLPENLKRAMEKGEPLYTMSPKGSLQHAFDERMLVRYLSTLPANKIQSIRFEDALINAAKYNKRFMERDSIVADIKAGRRVPDRVFTEGVSAPLLTFGDDSPNPGFTWRKIEDPEATAPEGAYVGHSVGGYSKGGGYGPDAYQRFVNGDVSIYSLRDDRNRPVTTIEVKNTKQGPIVSQIKGNGRATGNKPPSNYDYSVYQFLDQSIKPIAIEESSSYLTPLLEGYKKSLDAKNIYGRD